MTKNQGLHSLGGFLLFSNLTILLLYFHSQEVRYFSESYNSIEVLEQAVKENPTDCKLWLALAHQNLKNDNKNTEGSHSVIAELSNLENALSVLSRALEENQDNEELWICYLKLFAKNSSVDELRELCYQSVMYAATYDVWWTCLDLEITFVGKQEICTEMIRFVLESDMDCDKRSHCLLEIVLYISQVFCVRERYQLANGYLSTCLGGDKFINEKEKIQIESITESLTVKDKCIMWICLFSLQVFNELPKNLFEYENSGPGRIISKEKFVLDWRNKTKNLNDAQIRSLFKGKFSSGSNTRSQSLLR